MKARPTDSSIALIRGCLGLSVAVGVLAVGAASAQAATLVVDDDAVQCPNAGYATIQTAVDHAQTGDTIHVCPGVYHESVTVDKPLRLQGDPDAVAALDCFAPDLGAADPTQQAIIDGAGGGFSEAFRLRADDVTVRGLVVQGFSVGVDAADRFSGYRIDRNLIQANTLFGIDFGSRGTRHSRVDHNCLRGNQWGVVSELDDDSLWKLSPGGPERGQWNARDLINARIDHNSTTGQASNYSTALDIAGPGQHVGVTIDHNLSRQDLSGIALQNATDSAILDNDLNDLENAIIIGGGTQELAIRGNRVRGNLSFGNFDGIRFLQQGFLDVFPMPDRDVVVAQNDVRAFAAGIATAKNTLIDSFITENIASDNAGNGIFLLDGNTGNVVRANTADNNGVSGITAFQGATNNTFDENSMHGNGWQPGLKAPPADARDLNPLLNGALQNTWLHNDCDTDIPTGMICDVK